MFVIVNRAHHYAAPGVGARPRRGAGQRLCRELLDTEGWGPSGRCGPRQGEAYRREEISRGKLKELAAMVALPADELDNLMADAGLDSD
jgi:hypothetical protein